MSSICLIVATIFLQWAIKWRPRPMDYALRVRLCDRNFDTKMWSDAYWLRCVTDEHATHCFGPALPI